MVSFDIKIPPATKDTVQQVVTGLDAVRNVGSNAAQSMDKFTAVVSETSSAYRPAVDKVAAGVAAIGDSIDRANATMEGVAPHIAQVASDAIPLAQQSLDTQATNVTAAVGNVGNNIAHSADTLAGAVNQGAQTVKTSVSAATRLIGGVATGALAIQAANTFVRGIHEMRTAGQMKSLLVLQIERQLIEIADALRHSQRSSHEERLNDAKQMILNMVQAELARPEEGHLNIWIMLLGEDDRTLISLTLWIRAVIREMLLPVATLTIVSDLLSHAQRRVDEVQVDVGALNSATRHGLTEKRQATSVPFAILPLKALDEEGIKFHFHAPVLDGLPRVYIDVNVEIHVGNTSRTVLECVTNEYYPEELLAAFPNFLFYITGDKLRKEIPRIIANNTKIVYGSGAIGGGAGGAVAQIATIHGTAAKVGLIKTVFGTCFTVAKGSALVATVGTGGGLLIAAGVVCYARYGDKKIYLFHATGAHRDLDAAEKKKLHESFRWTVGNTGDVFTPRKEAPA